MLLKWLINKNNASTEGIFYCGFNNQFAKKFSKNSKFFIQISKIDIMIYNIIKT